jgi:hypothetical protein
MLYQGIAFIVLSYVELVNSFVRESYSDDLFNVCLLDCSIEEMFDSINLLAIE